MTMSYGTIALAGAVLLGAACGGEPGAAPRSEEGAVVTVSHPVASAGSESFPGIVVAAETATLATRTSGQIREIRADVGTRVRAGQPLVFLDATDMAARIEAAEARLRLARRTHDRIASLEADGAASAQELDETTARLQGAEAALRDARAQASYTVLRAPFDGVVTRRDADPGDLAAPGRPILQLMAAGELEVRADLPGELAGRVAVDQVLPVRFPLSERDARVRITRIAPALELGSRRFRVEGVFDPALDGTTDVVPGAYVRLAVTRGDTHTRWIPVDAVVRRGQLDGVFTVEPTGPATHTGEAGAADSGGDDDAPERRLRLRWVRLGERAGDAVELLAGPGASVAVVRRPDATLYDGRPVADVREEAWSPGTGDRVAVAGGEDER